MGAPRPPRGSVGRVVTTQNFLRCAWSGSVGLVVFLFCFVNVFKRDSSFDAPAPCFSLKAPCLEKCTVCTNGPGEVNPKIFSDPESPADRPLSGSVGRVDPTRIWAPLGCRVGRSVGSFRPKIFFAALCAAVGRSVFTESETQKSHFLSRSVGDAELTFNFAPP